jgi:hypothetical protein
MKLVTATLAVGPLSRQIIEATYRYSAKSDRQLMLIASRNQIDHDGGYVEGWTTAQYAAHLSAVAADHPHADVLVCRDHCGPGFKDGKDDTLAETFATVEEDVRCGFDLLHLDLCRAKVDNDTRVEQTKLLMERALDLNPDVLFEVGTDENDGQNFASRETVKRNIESLLEVVQPVFYVIQTGSLVKEARQVGCYERKMVLQFAQLLGRYGLLLKEHNADYLTAGQIRERRGVVGAMNIAPQLGVVQTATVLHLCLVHGVNTDRFQRHVHKAGRWRKWSLGNLDNPYAATLVAGHYHFNDPEYMDLVRQLKLVTDVDEQVVEAILRVLGHYTTAYGG